MHWEDGQLHMTSLETRETNVQVQRCQVCVQFNTLPQLAWACGSLLADFWTWSHRHCLPSTLTTIFIHVHVPQRETVLRNHCFAEWFRSQVCDVFFAPSQSLGSDLVLHPQVRHICVLQLPHSLHVENVLRGFLRQWPALVLQQSPSHVSCSEPLFASDAPNAAASSSASALLFAMTLCFRVYAFRVCLPSIITPALDDFRVSLQPTQSESVNTVSSSASFPYSNTCPHCLSKPFQLGKALLIGTRHLLAQLVHSECYVCSVLTEEQTSSNL